MKILLIAVCLLFAVSIRADDDPSDPYLEFYKEQTIKCATENGIKGGTVQEIRDDDIKKSAQKPTCHRACIMKEVGLMKDSKISVEKMKETISKVQASHPEKIEKLNKLAEDCVKEKKDETEECKLAYDYLDCFLDKH